MKTNRDIMLMLSDCTTEESASELFDKLLEEKSPGSKGSRRLDAAHELRGNILFLAGEFADRAISDRISRLFSPLAMRIKTD